MNRERSMYVKSYKNVEQPIGESKNTREKFTVKGLSMIKSLFKSIMGFYHWHRPITAREG